VEPGPDSISDLKLAVKEAKAHKGGPVLIHINNDPLIYAPDGEGWWDVPVMPVSELSSTQQAYVGYSAAKKTQKLLIGKGAVERTN